MENKILVACPSKGRSATITKHTLRFLSNFDFQYPYKIFVEPQDYSAYCEHILENNLVVLPQNDMGLSFAKQFIQQYALQHGYKYVFKIDDDVDNVRLPELIGVKQTGVRQDKQLLFEKRVKVLNQLIFDSVEAMETIPEVGAISLMYGSDFRNYNGETFIGVNKRLQSNYLIRTDLLCSDGDFSCYEDFATFFTLLDKGFISLRYGLTALEVVAVGSNAGGIQSFNRKKNSLIEKTKLSQLFPFIAWRKVQKQWDFEPDFTKTMKNFELLKND